MLGTGFLVGNLNYLPSEVADSLNAYVVKLAVPVLLFMAMYQLEFKSAFNFQMLVSFYTGAVAAFVAGIILSRLIWKRRPGEAVAAGFCAVFSNTVLIGLPVSQLAFGEAILTPIFGIIAFHASFLYTLGMFTMEFSRRDGRGLWDTVKAASQSVLANPLMAGILMGMLVNLTGIKLFPQLEQALDMIRLTAIPAALVGIGIALNRYKISSEIPESLMVLALALAVHPAIAFVLAHHVFALDGMLVQAAVVLAAMPPGMNVYIFAAMYHRAESLSASVLIIGNILAVFTIPLWLVLIKSL